MSRGAKRGLLGVIYLGFLSLGLPDGTLGVAWPQMHQTLALPIGLAGPLLLFVTLLAAGSSFASGGMERILGVGPMVMISCLLTAVGLALIGQAQNLSWLVVAAVPLGLGAGAVDAGLNGYVAKHYEARHMNWLHAFWGLGATLGPLVVASCLGSVEGWRSGYWWIAAIQLSFVAVFAVTLGWWRELPVRKIQAPGSEAMDGDEPVMGANSEAGVLSALVFTLYVGVEITFGLWIATSLVETRGATLGGAGFWGGAYFGSIALGRVLTGFVVERWGNRRVVSGGALVALVGAGLWLLPGPGWVGGLAVLLVGAGFAPIYPGMMHEVPRRFAPSAVQTMIGRQTSAAYVGGAVVPAGSGWLVQQWGAVGVSWLLLGGVLALIATIWRVNRLT